MRIIHFILALMFMVFAFLQVNDPDPLLWILIYGSMAVVCVMAMFNFYVRSLMIVQALGYLIYSFLLWSGVSEWLASDDKALLFDDLAKMQYPYIEESREFLGLMICLVVLGICFVRDWMLRKK